VAQRSIGFLGRPEHRRREAGTARGGPPAMARRDSGGAARVAPAGWRA